MNFLKTYYGLFHKTRREFHNNLGRSMVATPLSWRKYKDLFLVLVKSKKAYEKRLRSCNLPTLKYRQLACNSMHGFRLVMVYCTSTRGKPPIYESTFLALSTTSGSTNSLIGWLTWGIVYLTLVTESRKAQIDFKINSKPFGEIKTFIMITERKSQLKKRLKVNIGNYLGYCYGGHRPESLRP